MNSTRKVTTTDLIISAEKAGRTDGQALNFAARDAVALSTGPEHLRTHVARHAYLVTFAAEVTAAVRAARV
jgi:hypothetical protein